MPQRLRGLLLEPVIHFIVAGAALYGLFVLANGAEDARQIKVDADVLVEWMVARDPMLDTAAARQRFEVMRPGSREDLINEFVREEVLYREALAMGLEQEDYAKRRRLIDRLLWVNDAWARDAVDVTEADLEAWYRDHEDEYREPARYTFAHVFVGPDTTTPAAASLRDELNAQAVSFNDAGEYGQRFLYHRYYIDRSPDEVAAHFGKDFVAELAGLTADPSRWQGPITSTYGQHLVLLNRVQIPELPPIEQIRARVADDIVAARVAGAQQRFFVEARSNYAVSIASDLAAPTAPSLPTSTP